MKQIAYTIFGLWMGLAGPATAGPVQISMELGDYRFKPARLEVSVGQEVELKLTNTDSITPHNFVLKAPEAGLDMTVDVPPGASKTVRFTPGKPGFFPFYCDKRLLFFKSHRERGMHGVLTVNAK